MAQHERHRRSCAPRSAHVSVEKPSCRIGSFILLLLFVALWLLPFAWALDTALKPEAETTIVPIRWWSAHFNLDAFGKVLATGTLPRWYLNSVIISGVITVVTVVIASLIAFAFSQILFRGRWLLFWLVMAGIMVPGQILIVPLFTMMNDLNFVDTYWGVILPQLASPIAVFVFKQFFDGMPHELAKRRSSMAAPDSVSTGRSGCRWPGRPWQQSASSPSSGPGTTFSGR